MIRPDDIVLFQGDSITDCGRDRAVIEPNQPEGLGLGYARYAAAMLLADHPGVTIYNRGIGGDKVWQLEQRWRADCLDLRPTVLSILIGVNDTWHAINGDQGSSLDRYESACRKLLDDARGACDGVRFILCEPFVLRCGEVTDAWFPEIDHRRAIVKQIAADYGGVFVPFQRAFDDAIQQAPPAYWADDGVHPSIAGHMLMARTWIEAADKRG